MSAVDTSSGTDSPATLHGAALEAHTRKLAADQERAVTDGSATENAPEATAADPYQAWVDSQPAEFRDKFQAQVRASHAQSLAQFYGPEVSEILKEAGQDPEFRKKLGKLTDKDRRTFLLETADAIYEAQDRGEARGSDPKLDAIDQRVAALDQKITAQQMEERTQRYLADRTAERDALLAKFPELRWSDPTSPSARRLTAVIEEAEERSQRTGRPVSYAEQYESMKSMWTDQEANPARPPIRSQAGNAPPSRQAPRNKVDARNAMTAELSKYGGLSGLAGALRR